MDKINQTIADIKPLDKKAMEEARIRQDSLTKPRGSLGQLETLSIQVAGIKGNPKPRIIHKVIFTLAGDHGVTKEEKNIIEKSGTWYAYGGQRIGQGRENAKQFLKENPKVLEQMEKEILENFRIAKSGSMG